MHLPPASEALERSGPSGGSGSLWPTERAVPNRSTLPDRTLRTRLMASSGSIRIQGRPQSKPDRRSGLAELQAPILNLKRLLAATEGAVVARELTGERRAMRAEGEVLSVEGHLSRFSVARRKYADVDAGSISRLRADLPPVVADSITAQYGRQASSSPNPGGAPGEHERASLMRLKTFFSGRRNNGAHMPRSERTQSGSLVREN
jgi:hypothetical protein